MIPRTTMCFPGLFQALIGSFSNKYGDGSKNDIIKMHLLFFKLHRVYSNLLRELPQNFPGVEFLEPEFRKRKNSPPCVSSSIKRRIRKFHVVVGQ